MARSSAARKLQPTRSASFAAEFKAAGAPSDRTFQFTYSDASVDRVGDTIDAAGWDVAAYLKNPVVLFVHDGQSIPIGKTTKLWVEGDALKGQIRLGTADVDELVYQKLCAGELGAVSVGFLPLESEFSNEDDRQGGIDFVKQELLEVSIVPVPANRNALLEPRTKSMTTTKLNDSGGEVLAGHIKTLGEHVEKMATHVKDMGEMQDSIKALLGADATAGQTGDTAPDKGALAGILKAVGGLDEARTKAVVEAVVAVMAKAIPANSLSPEHEKCIKSAHKALTKSLNLHHGAASSNDPPKGDETGGSPDGDEPDEDDKKALAAVELLRKELDAEKTRLTGRLS